MSKYNLVIQGPIVSIGTTGKTYLDYNQTSSNSAIVSYNCIDNINKTLKDFAYLFEKIIIVTWEGAPISKSDLIPCQNLELLKLQELQHTYKSKKTASGQVNLLKQFYSLQAGVEKLSSQPESNFIIKLRTDQYLPLDRLITEHSSFSKENNAAKIFIPFFLKSRNNISDFYFVSSIKVMKAFCAAVMEIPKYKEINLSITSVHQVIPVVYFKAKKVLQSKMAYYLYLKSFNPKINRLGRTIYNCSIAKEMTQHLMEHFQSFSQDILYSTIWRGDKIQAYDDHSFELNTDFKKTYSLNFRNLFIYLTPKHYLSSKASLLNIQVTLGLFNFSLMSVMPGYRKRTLQKYTVNA